MSTPRSLMLTFLGDYLYDSGSCVFSGSVIEVLARLGVSEHATRSALARMVNRGLLRRQRDGRRMYYGLTPRTVEILNDGQQRIWKTGAVNSDWDGTWTLLGFSLPESWQRQRHDLRSQLAWAGFGPLQGGLWIAPGHVQVEAIVAGLGAHVRVFRARADALTDIGRLVDDAYDLDRLAAGYRTFLARWDGAGPVPFDGDPLAAHLSIVTEWLRIIRRDPRLPVRHLPEDWPAVAAQRVFHRLEARLDRPARTLATRLLETVPDEAPASTA
ncbi:PaaX family transcriptional regulator C-terminal domain-containing protein [Actinophytocola sp.]|uniref:PaaX family transcriptional regulator n=1 Tax=Actinophytocola sp. TaxID=1872138 RepID=UPI002D7E9842|nr:PaaX family transcriptional regulator C-terminal domain-containing protein [Actinophytocola sp.]HET9141974.1 PaaX family transcriptional regulator C-terminal domain-containing protein [Actinophytocola sp.]